MLGHRQPLASPDGECFHPAVGKMFYVVGTQCYMPAFLFCTKRRKYIIIQIFFELFSKKLFRNGVYRWHLIMGRKGEKRLSGYSEDYISKCFWVFH